MLVIQAFRLFLFNLKPIKDMVTNTNQTISVVENPRSRTLQMLVANPHNGQLVDLMPLFDYMETIKDWYTLNHSEPSHIGNVVDSITESHIDIMADVLDCTNGVSLSDKSLTGHTYALQNSIRLSRVFKTMTVEYPIPPPMPMPTKNIERTVFINPATSEIFKIEPLFGFIEKYRSDNKTSVENTANVIETTANVTDQQNPNLDLTNSTDLLRDVAKLLRDMKVA